MTPVTLSPAERRLLEIVHAEAEEIRAQARRLFEQAAHHINGAVAVVLESHGLAAPQAGRPRVDLQAGTLSWEGDVPEVVAPAPATTEAP